MDIPIIFSGPMVRALLDGRKTMTRRLAWRMSKGDRSIPFAHPTGTAWQKVKPGDRLWVREAICKDWEPTIYRADEVAEYGGAVADHNNRWTPSIHMPRRASRITLVVTATKIERVQNISEEDARAEGVLYVPGHGDIAPADLAEGYSNFLNCRMGFEILWDSLHGSGAWAANPEVVALTFTVHKQNIGQLARAA